MSDTPAVGALAKMCMDAASPIDTSSEPFEFVSEDLHLEEEHVESEGIRGTRSRLSHRVRSARKRVTGPVRMNPSVTELDLLWPRILGGTTAAGVTDVANTLPEFLLAVDRVTKVMTYDGLRVAQAVFTFESGRPVVLDLQLEGETETVGNAGTFPALTLDTDNMFICSDATLTLSAAARKFRRAVLTIDNLLDTERYLNAVSRTEIPALDRRVTLEVDAPYTSDNQDLYAQAVAGAAGTLAVADGTTTYTFAFGNVKIPSRSPNVPGRQEIFLPVRARCYSTASASECKVTKS